MFTTLLSLSWLSKIFLLLSLHLFKVKLFKVVCIWCLLLTSPALLKLFLSDFSYHHSIKTTFTKAINNLWLLNPIDNFHFTWLSVAFDTVDHALLDILFLLLFIYHPSLTYSAVYIFFLSLLTVLTNMCFSHCSILGPLLTILFSWVISFIHINSISTYLAKDSDIYSGM